VLFRSLQPFADDQTTLPLPGSPYPEVANRIAELYDPLRLNREMQRNREDYAAAVHKATGLQPEAATKTLAEVYGAHVYEPVSLAAAAAEVGLPVEAVRLAWSGTGDPALLKLLTGGSVTRKAWEASFQEAALRAESTKTPEGN